jgi:hypothetical protein
VVNCVFGTNCYEACGDPALHRRSPPAPSGVPRHGRGPSRPENVPRIGVSCSGLHSEPERHCDLEAFRQGLRELGYVEGQSIAIESRWAMSALRGADRVIE